MCHWWDAKLPWEHYRNISAISTAKCTVTIGFQSYRTPLEQLPLLIHPSKTQSNKQTEKGSNSILACAWTTYIQMAFRIQNRHSTFPNSQQQVTFPTWWISCHPFSSLQLTVACSWSSNSQQNGSPPHDGRVVQGGQPTAVLVVGRCSKL